MGRLSPIRVTLAAVFIVCTACSVAASAKAPPIAQQLQGQWQGTLRRAKLPEAGQNFDWSSPARIRIDITAANISVYVWNDEKWREIKPRTFGVTFFDTNAVITSITSGRDEDGTWVETWSFALSVIDSHRVHASFQRQVNNKDLKRDDPNAAWGEIAFGTFERMSDADV